MARHARRLSASTSKLPREAQAPQRHYAPLRKPRSQETRSVSYILSLRCSESQLCSSHYKVRFFAIYVSCTHLSASYDDAKEDDLASAFVYSITDIVRKYEVTNTGRDLGESIRFIASISSDLIPRSPGLLGNACMYKADPKEIYSQNYPRLQRLKVRRSLGYSRHALRDLIRPSMTHLRSFTCSLTSSRTRMLKLFLYTIYCSRPIYVQLPSQIVQQ